MLQTILIDKEYNMLEVVWCLSLECEDDPVLAIAGTELRIAAKEFEMLPCEYKERLDMFSKNLIRKVRIAKITYVIAISLVAMAALAGCQYECRSDLLAQGEFLKANGIDPKENGFFDADPFFKVIWRRISSGNLMGERIEYLQMDGIGIKTVPTAIGKLTELKRIDFSYSQLTALPPEIGKLTKLEELILKGNFIKYLPEEIGFCTSLVEIDLNTNELDTLPHGLGNLHNLIKIDLDNNKLTKLPPTIGGLKKVEQLHASYNQLSALPEGIVGMAALKSMMLTENKFVICPSICTTLAINAQLEEIGIGGNPLDVNTLPANIRSISPYDHVNPTDYVTDFLEIRKLRNDH